ncbi:hypothetical protein [Falsiroseomonas sp. E2-1-a20]|uniref:hypothetical protein n=1 Tax=Falsiroseomonas sp. E2-1-a20 TaxID=3239300 RepID=UPI003F3656A7
MTAFLAQLLATMALPLPILFGLCAAGLLRPLPWGMLAGASASGFGLFVGYLGSHTLTKQGRARPPIAFWQELPVWAAASALWVVLFFLLFRAFAWALARLPPAPGPPPPN